MYSFEVKVAGGYKAGIFCESNIWDESGEILFVDPLGIADNFMKSEGHTPHGLPVDNKHAAPMDVYSTFDQSEDWQITITRGERLPYPPKYTGMNQELESKVIDEDGQAFLDAASYQPEPKKHEFTAVGRKQFQGIPITIENFAGGTRKGVDPDGKPWSIKMKYDYGYISGTVSADDGEGIDVYVGNDKTSDRVYIVHQHKIEAVRQWPSKDCPSCSEAVHDCACPEYFDEDKVMMGFPNKKAAVKAYLSQYDDERFLGVVSTMTLDEFKKVVLKDKGKEKSFPYRLTPEAK